MFSAKNRQKNKNIQSGSEKQYSYIYIYKKECIAQGTKKLLRLLKQIRQKKRNVAPIPAYVRGPLRMWLKRDIRMAKMPFSS